MIKIVRPFATPHTVTVYTCHCSKDNKISIYLKSKKLDDKNTSLECQMQIITKWETTNLLYEEVKISSAI